MVENGLREQRFKHAVAERFGALENQTQAQHWLLTEMVREQPRHALETTAKRLHQVHMGH